VKINVYIGYNSKEDFSDKFPNVVNPPYSVAKYSILKNYKGDENDLSIQPIKLQDVIDAGLYWREEDPLASTEFTYSRFLTPHLNDYKGIAIFCDSDFLWQCDINEVLEYYDEKYAVMCVQHDYIPKSDTKMDGVVQTTYPKKNWSSLMVFNCEHENTKNLTVENVNEKSPKYLHRMEWTDEVGSIPITYNYLEGDYEYIENPKVIHFTNGGPWHETWDGDYKNKWIKQYEELI
jgi:lipopolysaccharide biosynthesis glycosyltransferase